VRKEERIKKEKDRELSGFTILDFQESIRHSRIRDEICSIRKEKIVKGHDSHHQLKHKGRNQKHSALFFSIVIHCRNTISH
jgi:hypothetical protein